jgi:hypothetical protein
VAEYLIQQRLPPNFTSTLAKKKLEIALMVKEVVRGGRKQGSKARTV